MHLSENQAIFLAGQVAHLAVGLPVVEGNRREVVKGGVKIVRDMG